MKAKKILIVEDNRALGMALAAATSQTGARTELVASASLARKELETAREPFTAMILDIGLPDQNGLSFLESLPESCRPPTIVITAHGELENTIQARKLGVLAFFPKPLDFPAFKEALVNLPMPKPVSEPEESPHSTFIGAAPSMRPVFQQIAQACASDVPVLITGETGTGKSLTAQIIQRDGMDGKPQPKAFNPAPENQCKDLTKALEEARGRSLVLENVGSLEKGAQAELVGRWEGNAGAFPRILATCSGNLREAVEAGTFRSDLYYRLQVLEIHMPPLRERMGDVDSLFSYFLGQLQPGRGLQAHKDVSGQLLQYDWPGNLRELRNVASFAVTASTPGTTILHTHLPEYLTGGRVKPSVAVTDSLDGALDQWLDRDGNLPPYKELADELERRLLGRLMPRFDGKLARLAKQMGANRSTLRKKLRG